MIQVSVTCKQVYLIGLGDLTDDLPGGRVDGGERFPVDGFMPFIIDEELNKGRIVLCH